MSSSNITEFIEGLKKQHRIISSPRPATGFDNKISDAQLNLHNQWAKPAFNQSKYTYSYSYYKSNISNNIKFINDLTPIEKSDKEELDISRIKEIYNTKNDESATYSPLSSAISYDHSISPKIPHDLLDPEYGWLSFSPGKCILPKAYESYEITGFIQLYDGKYSHPISEPVKLRITGGEALFSQTIASSVNFPLSAKNPYILCVLNYSKEKAKCSIPFSLDVVPLFNEKGQFLQPKKFSSQWGTNSSNIDELIKKKITNEGSYEKVDIEFNFNCTFSEKLFREFSYSWSSTPNTNFYVSPFPTVSYQSTPIILLYNLSLSMKYPANVKRVCLKFYITEGLENISSPSSLSLFSGVEMGKFSNFYLTPALKTAQKEVDFIDHVPIFVDRSFASTTCIIVHIFSYDENKNGSALLGYAAIPLFQDGNPIPHGSYKFKIFDQKKPPKDMKKLIRKSNKKKDFLQCTIRLPPPYFPPSTVKNVVEAVMPEQALPPNYKEISIDVYQRQILPMTGKLLKIIAPNTALHLLRFLDIFENEKNSVKKTLRSWVFNVMNPALFGPNFVNNLCNAFKSVINDELWNKTQSASNDPNLSLRDIKNILLKQLGFTLPIILDIIMISVSTPEIQYDQDVILDFLAHIPPIIYSLIKSRAKVTHVKNENQSQRSSKVHSHHMQHSQGNQGVNSNDNDSQSSPNSSLAKDSTGQSRASVSDSKKDDGVMSPLRLPPRALAPLIPEIPTNAKTPNSSNLAPSQSEKNIPLLQERNNSSSFFFSTKENAEEIDLNNHFGNIISCLLPIFGFDKVSPLIFKYIRFLNTKKLNEYYASFLSYLQFAFLIPFSYSEHFIVELALRCKISESSEISAYIPILSQIYLVLHKSLSGQNEIEEENEPEVEGADNEIDAISIACKFFVNVCLSAERLPPELSTKVAFILFPLINIISSNYEGALVKKNVNIMKELIPIILFILNASSTTLIQNFFSELGASFQVHFLNFLVFIVRLSIDKLNTVRPVSIKGKRNALSGMSPAESNLNFFSILTQHILNFIIRTIDTLGHCVDLVVKLLSALYNSYQPVSNVGHFYSTCSLLIQKYPVNRSLIAWLLSLLSFEQPDTKCFACALLVLVFQVDFKNTKKVIISSIDMMDSLTAVLLAVPVKYIPTYKTLLNRIISLTKADVDLKSGIDSSQKKEFEKMVNERMNAALIISNVVEEQKQSTLPPELRCQRLMRIADQYKMFPTMRLKWLLEIVKVNTQLKSYSSAFTAQLHVCALVETVVDQLSSTEITSLLNYNSLPPISSSSNITPVVAKSLMNKDFNFFLKTTQPMRNAQPDSFILDPKEDFSFMPGVLMETELQIESLAKDSQTLLSDFTIDLLLDSLEKAINLGKSASLEYSLRPLYSLQLRIYHIKGKQPHKISRVLQHLSESIAAIQTKTSSLYDLPFSFFLVEYRKDNKKGGTEKKQNVFCIENAMYDQFMTFINTNNRFEEGMKATLCSNHNVDSCKKPGVCVVKLQPTLMHSNHSKEFDHCFKKFFAVINNSDETVEIIEYTTKDFLPHYRLAADVVDEKHSKVQLIDHVRKTVENAVEMLNIVASEFEIWYPMKPTNEAQREALLASKGSSRATQSLKIKKSVSSSASSSASALTSAINNCVPDEKYVLDDIKRISAVLRFVLKGNESVATMLETVLTKLKGKSDTKKIELVLKMAAQIYSGVARVLDVYRRAVSEFQTKQPNESLLSLCDMMAEEFATTFGLEKMEKREYVAEYDPFNDGIDYE